jgi:hypothetical protein
MPVCCWFGILFVLTTAQHQAHLGEEGEVTKHLLLLPYNECPKNKKKFIEVKATYL